jgi:hypothetical protein
MEDQPYGVPEFLPKLRPGLWIKRHLLKVGDDYITGMHRSIRSGPRACFLG